MRECSIHAIGIFIFNYNVLYTFSANRPGWRRTRIIGLNQGLHRFGTVRGNAGSTRLITCDEAAQTYNRDGE